MGLLDDAIREHLELKRKHGANPEDVARQEQEALGPGQRNEFAQPEGAAQAPPEPESALKNPRRSRRRPEARAAAPSTSSPRASRASPRSRPPRRRRATTRTRGSTTSPTRSRPRRRSQERPRRPARRTGEEDDVLEETPDFLQETPEHDRLWFEQKPPKDFDWDK